MKTTTNDSSSKPHEMPSSVLGPLLIAAGAALFACTNCASTAYFRRGGTIVTLYLIRSVVVYISNGALVAATDGRAVAARVLSLRTGQLSTTRLVAVRSLVFSSMTLFMSLGYVLLTFSDAFTVMKGTDMLTVVIVARTLLDRTERLTLREMGCGLLTLVGITMIVQPAAIFGATGPDGPRVSAVGFAVALIAGGLAAGVGVLTRLLSQAWHSIA